MMSGQRETTQQKAELRRHPLTLRCPFFVNVGTKKKKTCKRRYAIIYSLNQCAAAKHFLLSYCFH